DFNTFVVAHPHHAAMNTEWKHDFETRRDKAKNFLISGEDTLEVRDDEMQIEVVTAEIPTSPYKAQTTMVPPVTVTIAVSFPTKPDIIKQFTLNTELIVYDRIEMMLILDQQTLNKQLLPKYLPLTL
ncbi:unnamed protein product, partial [Rotaria sp. Silwood2]